MYMAMSGNSFFNYSCQIREHVCIASEIAFVAQVRHFLTIQTEVPCSQVWIQSNSGPWLSMWLQYLF